MDKNNERDMAVELLERFAARKAHKTIDELSSDERTEIAEIVDRFIAGGKPWPPEGTDGQE